MGFLSAGGYARRGGDEALVKSYRTLYETARKGGYLDPNRDSPIPTGLLSAFQRVGDILSRPNYAIAGAADVLQGTGDANETVGERMAREFFSGIGGLQGKKETFGDVLEQRGVDAGGRLSDIIGQNKLTKYFDPTARGTAGLAMDIFLDPTTYVSFGSTGVARVINKGGRIVSLTDDGAKQLSKFTRSRLMDEARRLSVEGFEQLDDVALEHAVGRGLAAEIAGKQMENVAFERLAFIKQNEIVDRIGTQFADEVLTSSARGLTTSNQLLLGLPGTRFVVGTGLKTSTLSAPVRGMASVLAGAIKGTQRGEDFVNTVSKGVDTLDRLFNSTPRLARQLDGYKRRRDLMHALSQSADQGAKKDVKFILGRHTGKTDGDLWRLYLKAIDDPDTYKGAYLSAAEKAKIGADEAGGLLTRWKEYSDYMQAVEMNLGILDSAAPNYVPRTVKGLAGPEFDKLGARSEMTNYFEARTLNSFDEFEQAMAGRGIDPARVNYDPSDVFEKRIAAHYQKVNRALFVRDALERFAVGSRASVADQIKVVLKDFDLAGFRKKVGETDLEAVLKAGDGDVKAFQLLRPELRAAAALRMMERVHSLEAFEEFEKKFGREIDKISPEILNRVRSSYKAGGQKFGQDIVKWSDSAGKEYFLPRGIADDLNTMGDRWTERKEVNALFRVLDRFTNTFKLSVTSLFPAFNFRNMYSNVFASSADISLSTMDPRMHAKVLAIALGKDTTLVTKQGRRYTASQLRSMMEALDIRVDHTAFAELTGETRTLFSAFERSKLFRASQQVPRGIENEARAAHFLTLLRRGYSPGDAANRVKRYLFDYSDLSPFEQNVMRRLIPFYTWQSKNVRVQVRNLLEKPGYFANQYKAVGRDRGPENDSLPSYLRGDSKVGVDGNFITNIDLPVNNVNILWSGDLGKTMRENFAMINPIIKNPIEWMFNMDTFTGKPIRGQQWIGRMGPVMERRLPQWAQDFFELEGVKMPDKTVAYRANGTRMYLTLKSMYVGRLTSTAVDLEETAELFTNGDPNWPLLMAKFLTGMQFREFDLREGQRRALNNKVKALEELLLREGVAREFGRVYVPEETRKRLGVRGR